MKRQLKTVNEIAKLTGITIRALHYYDEINLLKPSDISEAGYRFYSNKDIETLQQIMFLKEIGFELKQIKEMIRNSDFDRRTALEKHKEILILKKRRIENLIKLIESKLKGNQNLSFSEFNESSILAKQKEYHEEVLQRWKNTQAYREFETKQYHSNSELSDLDKKAREIFSEIAEYMEYPPSCKKVQELILAWKDYLTENYYNCTNEMLRCLAQMYVEDERFKSYINRLGDNLAQYINEAINFYCESEN